MCFFGKAGKLRVHPPSHPCRTAALQRGSTQRKHFVLPPAIRRAAREREALAPTRHSEPPGVLRPPQAVALCSGGRVTSNPPGSELRRKDFKGSQASLKEAHAGLFIVSRDRGTGGRSRAGAPLPRSRRKRPPRAAGTEVGARGAARGGACAGGGARPRPAPAAVGVWRALRARGARPGPGGGGRARGGGGSARSGQGARDGQSDRRTGGR